MTKAHIATDYGYCDVGRPNLSVVYAIVNVYILLQCFLYSNFFQVYVLLEILHKLFLSETT